MRRDAFSTNRGSFGSTRSRESVAPAVLRHRSLPASPSRGRLRGSARLSACGIRTVETGRYRRAHVAHVGRFEKWLDHAGFESFGERRGRDLNPRRACPLNGFRDRLRKAICGNSCAVRRSVRQSGRLDRRGSPGQVRVEELGRLADRAGQQVAVPVQADRDARVAEQRRQRLEVHPCSDRHARGRVPCLVEADRVEASGLPGDAGARNESAVGEGLPTLSEDEVVGVRLGETSTMPAPRSVAHNNRAERFA
jgi:hypothetical protein